MIRDPYYFHNVPVLIWLILGVVAVVIVVVALAH